MVSVDVESVVVKPRHSSHRSNRLLASRPMRRSEGPFGSLSLPRVVRDLDAMSANALFALPYGEQMRCERGVRCRQLATHRPLPLSSRASPTKKAEKTGMPVVRISNRQLRRLMRIIDVCDVYEVRASSLVVLQATHEYFQQ